MTVANKTAYFLINALIIFTALAYGTVHQPILALFYLVVAVLVLLWSVDCLRTGVVRYSTNLLQVPIYAAAVYGFIQVIPFGWYSTAGVDGIPRTISVDPYSTEMTALHFLALALLFSVMLVLLDRAKRIRRVVTVIMIFGFVFAFFAILQGVLSPTKIYGIYERQFATPYGSFVNRHNFAAYMEMVIAVPLAMVMTGAVKRDLRLLFLTAVLLMSVALFLSGSRGGFISLVAELIILVMMTARFHSRQKLFMRVALAGALLVAIVAGTFFVGGESSLTRIAETASSKDITTNRTHIWAVTLNVIRQTAPLGGGLGAFGVAYTPNDTLSGLERVEQAHNDFLQTIADGGIVGLLLGGAFLFLLFRTTSRNVKRQNNFRRAVAIGASAGIFAVLIHSIFDFVLHTTAVSVLFITLMALLVAAGNQFDDDTQDEEPRRPRRKGSLHQLSQNR
jgi:O-antigen ligase